MDQGFWQGRRVFVTGHTGFKGGWLSIWLELLGAKVHGFALPPPTNPSLFDVAGIEAVLTSHTIGDVRDYEALHASMAAAKPEIVIHMAAQPLVRLSYLEPVDTYATNVMGTVHVLEAARGVDSVRAVVNVTSDKCYENLERERGYREDDAMGGYDPYSSSKGAAELVTQAYRRSYFGEGKWLASARAGNVIGGGDWAADRLVPDIFRAREAGEPLTIRSPNAVRPWQHVLEPLRGYLMLTEQLATRGDDVTGGWNFGPDDDDAWPVRKVVEYLVPTGEGVSIANERQPHEATMLKLDSSKAKNQLGWKPVWNVERALAATVAWQQVWSSGGDMLAACRGQIADCVEGAA